MVAKDRDERFACPGAVVTAVTPFAAGAQVVGLSGAAPHRGAVPAA